MGCTHATMCWRDMRYIEAARVWAQCIALPDGSSEREAMACHIVTKLQLLKLHEATGYASPLPVVYLIAESVCKLTYAEFDFRLTQFVTLTVAKAMDMHKVWTAAYVYELVKTLHGLGAFCPNMCALWVRCGSSQHIVSLPEFWHMGVNLLAQLSQAKVFTMVDMSLHMFMVLRSAVAATHVLPDVAIAKGDALDALVQLGALDVIVPTPLHKEAAVWFLQQECAALIADVAKHCRRGMEEHLLPPLLRSLQRCLSSTDSQEAQVLVGKIWTWPSQKFLELPQRKLENLWQATQKQLYELCVQGRTCVPPAKLGAWLENVSVRRTEFDTFRTCNLFLLCHLRDHLSAWMLKRALARCELFQYDVQHQQYKNYFEQALETAVWRASLRTQWVAAVVVGPV